MSELPKRADLIDVGEYWRYGLSVDAICQCGHRRNIHAGMLVQWFGNNTSMGEVGRRKPVEAHHSSEVIARHD